jgi:tRNA(Ile)-lysidine synthase
MNKNETLAQKFVVFNRKKHLACSTKKVLLAVSGGIDSVVMCELFYQAGFPFAIAHCNFQLRGDEADKDEKFVLALAAKYNAEFFAKKFDTQNYAAGKNISVQEAARELRYNWFEKLKHEKKMMFIATAHHLNDNIETILFNFIKGTGIRGLRGIKERNGNIIRPLLFATRNEIENFSRENNLQWREDDSNINDKYTRNKIRHQIIPLLKEINPSLEHTIAERIELLTQIENQYERELANSNKQLFLARGNDVYISLAKLAKTKNAKTVLFEYLKNYGFTAAQAADVLLAINAAPGKEFISKEARLIRERKFFILTSLANKKFSIQFLHRGDSETKAGDKKISIQRTGPIAEKNQNTNVVLVDEAKIEFPLVVRKWKAGDYFYPFGMGMKKKKLKKFLTDIKIPVHEKEDVWIIESNKRIVWVVGYRLDERFKIATGTTTALRIKCS